MLIGVCGNRGKMYFRVAHRRLSGTLPRAGRVRITRVRSLGALRNELDFEIRCKIIS